MKLPRVVKLRWLKKRLREYGVQYIAGRKHMCFRSDDGVKYPIPFDKDSDDVERTYVEAARRAYGLTPENGISDQEFYRRR